MRTASIIAETHEGKEVLLSGHKTPIVEQLQSFRKLQALRVHPEYAVVRFQESDGILRTIKFSAESPALNTPTASTNKPKSK